MQKSQEAAAPAGGSNGGSGANSRKTSVASSNGGRRPSVDEENKENKKEMAEPVAELRKTSAVSASRNIFVTSERQVAAEAAQSKAKARPVSKVFGRVSKFKHLKGDVILKGRFENLKNLSKTCTAESDFFHGERGIVFSFS